MSGHRHSSVIVLLLTEIRDVDFVKLHSACIVLPSLHSFKLHKLFLLLLGKLHILIDTIKSDTLFLHY